MPAPAIATIILAVVVVLVLAGFLLTIARVLVDVHKKLGPVIETVGTIASMTKPVEPVVRSITGNLATARDGLSSLLESKVGVDGAAELVASVDPLTKENTSPHSFARVEQDEPSRGAAEGEVSPHSFARADEDESPTRSREGRGVPFARTDQDELSTGLADEPPTGPADEPPTELAEGEASPHSFARADQDETGDVPPWWRDLPEDVPPEDDPPTAPHGDSAAFEPETPKPDPEPTEGSHRPFPGGGGGGIKFRHHEE